MATPRGALKIHLGCGLCVPPDWVNVDGSCRRHESKIPGNEAVENNEGLIAEGMRPAPPVP